MEELRAVLETQLKMHPNMRPEDLIRLIWQNEFGPSHSMRSPEDALEKIREDLDSSEYEEDAVLYEDIGNGYLRLNFRGIDRSEYSPEEILEDFADSVRNASGSGESFLRKLLWVTARVDEFDFSFSERELEETVKKYLSLCKRTGYRSLVHSEEYLQKEKPVYRVIRQEKKRDFQGKPMSGKARGILLAVLAAAVMGAIALFFICGGFK